ncbi:MAG: tetratricopeptide repeat protein [Patescibacteria group bacterium]|nr:tetratricopeptide repeat protein [Patescibacteria group bacterium]
MASSQTPSTKLDSFLDFIQKASIHLVVFLIPVFFLPSSISSPELSKLSLLIILVGIAGVSWMGRMVSRNQLELKKSFLSVPIFVFSAAYLLSCVFSIYPENSVWGFAGTQSISLVALLFFVLFFYIISNNFHTKKSAYLLILNLFVSSLAVFTIAFLQIIGQNVFQSIGITGKDFTTIGSVYALSAYAGSILVLSSAIITENVSGYGVRTAAVFSSLAAFIVLTLVNFKLVWLVLAIIMAILMIVGILRNARQKSNLFIIPTIIFIFCLFSFIAKKPVIPIQGLPTEISLSLGSTLKVGLQSLKERFLFGSGPGNFSYPFLKYRQPMGELSSLVFNQGTSYASTLFATGGLVTSLSLLFLIITMGRYAGTNVYKTFFDKTHSLKKQGKEDQGERLITPASLLWLFITLLLFFTAPSLSLLFVWWLAFALIDALSSKSNVIKIDRKKSRVSLLAERIGMRGPAVKKQEIPRTSLIISLMFVGIITGFIAIVYVLGQKFAASVYFQKAMTESQKQNPDAQKISQQISRAVYYNQRRDSYFLALSDTYFYLANQRIKEKGENINDEDRSYIWEAVSQSIQASSSAIAVNKNNANNYSKLAAMYQSIIGLVNGADQPALENYEKALALNPTDSLIHNQIARIYLARYDLEVISQVQKNKGKISQIPDSARDNLKRAKETVQKSLQNNPADPTSRLLLASIFELEGDLKGAIQVSEETLRTLGGNANTSLALALLYYKDKNYDKATNVLDALVKQWEDFSDARYILGLCYAQKRDASKALEQFRKIQELNPDNQEIKEIITNLQAGNFSFLGTAGKDKIQEVQEGIEDSQRQKDELENNILENQESNENQPRP